MRPLFGLTSYLAILLTAGIAQAPPGPEAAAAVTWPALLLAAWPYLLPLAIVLIASLVTRLTPYPRAAGVVTGLRVLLDVLSFLQHRDSPNTWQWPIFDRSTPPAGLELPPVPELPRAAGGAAFALALLSAWMAHPMPAHAEPPTAAPAAATERPQLRAPLPVVEAPATAAPAVPVVAIDPRVPLCAPTPPAASSSTAAKAMKWLGVIAAVAGGSAYLIGQIDALAHGRPALAP